MLLNSLHYVQHPPTCPCKQPLYGHMSQYLHATSTQSFHPAKCGGVSQLRQSGVRNWENQKNRNGTQIKQRKLDGVKSEGTNKETGAKLIWRHSNSWRLRWALEFQYVGSCNYIYVKYPGCNCRAGVVNRVDSTNSPSSGTVSHVPTTTIALDVEVCTMFNNLMEVSVFFHETQAIVKDSFTLYVCTVI